MSTARRAQLLATKLAVLIHEHGVGGEPRRGDFGGGAAAMVDDEAWVLLDAAPQRGLGPALGWGIRNGATAVHVIAESATGHLARRAQSFAVPIAVWHAEGRALLPAVSEPLPVPPPLPDSHRQFVDTIAGAGALPVVEHGVLSGEVAGLEVCRVVDDSFTATVRLEVGVGAHDREAFQLLHGDRPTAEALGDVVRSVGEVRHGGARPHPLNRLAAERLLRARLHAAPGLIGALAVTAAEPPLPRQNVKDVVPCVAIATFPGGDAVVVCTSGVDLDVVPYAADARTSTGLQRCLVVLPERDALAIQRDIGALLLAPVEWVTIAAGAV